VHSYVILRIPNTHARDKIRRYENDDPQNTQKNERKDLIMKRRNSIFAAILSALACFALLSRVQATPENDPDGPNRPARPNLPVMPVQTAPAPKTPDPGAVGGSFNTADGTRALGNVTTGIGTQHLVGFRSLATPTAASTPLSARGRSF
jgi:hypothetical protein